MGKKPEKKSGDVSQVIKIGGAAMGIIEEILRNKEDLLVKFLEILEGKEARTKIDLDGVEFKIGKSKIKMDGSIEFTFIPFEEKR